MRIGILGPLDVRDASGRTVELGGPRVRALLIRLALDCGRTVSSELLIHDLWEGMPPASPSAALQSLVSRLRAVGGRDLVSSGPAGYRLTCEPADVDAVEFERAVVAARSEERPQHRAAALRQALAMWRGPALTEVADASFAAAAIARLEGLRLTATEDRIEAQLTLGQAADLVPELDNLSAAHPHRERLSGLLMRALYAAGRQAAALQVYADTRRELAETLGVDPSPELAALQLAILRHDAALLPASAPAPGRRRTNLPASMTSFVGREAESAQLDSALRENRLVTLTGPGGAGKTRLAREVTSALVDDFVDGVWFVPMAPVSTPLDVPQAVLAAIGIPDVVRLGEVRAVVQPLDRLTDVLAERRLILVLDNCEHLIDAVARLADRVLSAAPGVRIVATSREPLGITGETLCPVPSLPLPEVDAGAAEAAKTSSVRLFADRAAAVRPGFAVNEETAHLVVDICRELDGIPLAIELAASRMRSLTLRQIADRLDDRFRLLSGGNRAALARHQTLRAVVDWSWDLLDDDERVVLRRLSVFTGGATPQSAELICSLDERPDRRDVIDVIAALIDKSLVTSSGDGEVRYRLLETVRAYAHERLTEAGETDRIGSGHAQYFAALAEQAEPQLRRHDQLHWLDRLTAERDNCNAALQHAIDRHDVPTAVRLVGSLAWFWVMRDYEAEAGGWAVAVHTMAGDVAPAGLEDQYAICAVMSALMAEMSRDATPTQSRLGQVATDALALISDQSRHPLLRLASPLQALMLGDLGAAEQRLWAVVDDPDPWVGAIAQAALGQLALNAGQVEQAHQRLIASYKGFREIGERWGKIIALRGLLELALIRNRPDDAVRFGEEAYGYATEGVSPEQGSAMLIQLGRARAEAGDLSRGVDEIERGASQAERIGEYVDAAGGQLILSELARRRGDLISARRSLERARIMVEPRAERVDFLDVCVRIFSLLGVLAEQESDLVAAAGWHEKALKAVGNEVITHRQTLAGVTEGIAALAAARGDHKLAAELLGTAHGVHGYRDERSLEVARTSTAAIAALGLETFEAIYASAVERDDDGQITVRLLALAQMADDVEKA